MTEHITVGFDGSPVAQAALDWAVGEARRRELRVQVVTVHQADDPELRSLRAQIHVVAEANPDVLLWHRDITGAPGVELVRLAGNSELLVVGSHGIGRVTSALLGSVSAYCVRHSPCPVVVVPAAMAEQETHDQFLTPGPLL
ncbi:universal stress protein [Actinokineospora sp. NBRC 105648]|uniref:universal stress protein n=1 Tax=Actinokineospora sp. NBRC 105648 TaxID=3032206 RepID=UPI00249FE743|nr:universal stress protein [Actinokineospora sp. NBRC 105648]GLZ36686.1 universal stress protein [Actinokineospora sp. NBRC 105648]